jgi:MarR family transcriptional regulator, organic hydroperoxide resistance regulator
MEMRQNVLNLMSKVRQRAFLFIERELAQRGIDDLSPAHGDILFVVYRRQPIEMGQLAEHTGRDKSTLSSLVARLVKTGYLTRRVDVTDRRRALITLTQKALKLAPALVKTGVRVERTMLKNIDVATAEVVVNAMRVMYDNLAPGQEDGAP